MRVIVHPSDGLVIVPTPIAGVATRGAAADGVVLPAEFRSDKVTVEKTYTVSRAPANAARADASLPMIAIDVETSADEAPLVVVRHPSGALTFHPGTPAAVARGVRTAGHLHHFRVPLRRGLTAEGQRGLVGDVVKVAVLKVAKPLVDAVESATLTKLARVWEERAWRKKGLAEGWFRVIAPAAGGPLRLAPGAPQPRGRNLVLLHGTFSHAASAFAALTTTDFFSAVAPVYEDRIYAFNHFTVSRSIRENVELLLSGMADGKSTCDVVTHSRGGLVLRALSERSAQFGPKAARFQLGRAVLVASPNDGTPLATPDRWDTTIGWIANLLTIVRRVMPVNPLITAADFVAEGIVWLAHHIAGELPGLRAMDTAGETIEDLQGPPPPPPRAYSALVANFQPDQNLRQLILDAGIDQFFGSANDLVVPSEGGWRVDRDGVHHIEPGSVGCFGPGGNIAPGEPSAVMHLSFFTRKETAAFLTRALTGQEQGLPAMNIDVPLPDHRFLRGIAAPAAETTSTALLAQARPTGPAPLAPPPGPLALPTTAARDTFHLVVIDVTNHGTAAAGSEDEEPKPTSQRRAIIYAAYGGARVVEEFPLRGGAVGRQWRAIIDIHNRIKQATDLQQGAMPSDDDMAKLGTLLFGVLFRGDVKRLYDTARSLQGTRRLNLIFTSMIPWVAEKPWEFAYDPGRRTHLATEEIEFVRNVLTQVPGDSMEPRPGPLRILVVSAQPPGTVPLSIDEETALIQRDFAALVEAGLAEVNVLPRATISALHGQLSTSRYNIVHFIGHGAFDRQANQGYLLFQSQEGAPPEYLDERSARELLCGRGISLLFLNACQTASSGVADSNRGANFNSGLAQSLVSHGLPALVANQYSVSDTAATSFAQFFYWGLARGLSLGTAAREARIAVNYSLNGDSVIDWAVPVLYARDPSNVLTTGRPGISRVMPVGAGPSASRRAALMHDVRIAVWDVDRALPNLEAVLQRMNGAQRRFGFQLANLSAPLDAFTTIHGRRHLVQERIAERLRGRAGELRVKYLLCLTDYPLSPDEHGRPVFAWWPRDLKSPVLIFSYAGMKLDPQAGATARALSNTIVRALAAMRENLELHRRGPVSCPMYANLGADIAIITRPQQFDAVCREKAADKAALADLDALLRVFDAPAAPGDAPTRSRQPDSSKRRAGRKSRRVTAVRSPRRRQTLRKPRR